MSEKNSYKFDGPADRQLAERLTRDARVGEHPFSEALHVRIVTATVECKSPVVGESSRTAGKRRPGTIAWLAIAASLLVLLAGGWRLLRGPEPVGSLDRSAARQLVIQNRFGHPDGASSDDYSLDDLNHSAGLALRLVVDQLPMDVSADEWGLPRVQ